MSEQVQSIIEAFRRLSPAQRHEVVEALATVQSSHSVVSEQEKRVTSIRGKYRHVPTSVDQFLDHKREDIVRESRS